jgi:hypothetical protein
MKAKGSDQSHGYWYIVNGVQARKKRKTWTQLGIEHASTASHYSTNASRKGDVR